MIVEFEGQKHDFPDNFSQEDIAKALGTYKPTTTGEAVGHGIMQGASFGLRDEGQGLIEAGGGGGPENKYSRDALTNLGYLARGAYRKLTGDPEAEARYKAATERERAYSKQIEQEHPGAYIGGQVGGALATLPVGFAARAPTMLGWGGRLAAGAKTGALTGALTGFGEGEGLEDSLKRAAIGAPLGGAIGGLATPLVEGLARSAGALASYPVSVARGLLTPGAASERAIGRALQQAAHSDPSGINRITTGQFVGGQAPADAVIGDVLGEPGRKLARSAANISPEAKETMNQALNARGEAQGARAISWLDNQFAFPNAHAQQQALDATRRTANNAAYDAAERAGAGGLWGPEFERLASSGEVADAMRTAIKTSQSEAVRRGMGGFNPKISFTPDGRIQFNRGPTGVPTYPDLRYWDQVRRELSDAARKAPRGSEEEMRLGGLAEQLNAALDARVPAYQVARRTAAGFFDARDALQAGQKFATERYANEGAQAAIREMNATERALFRDGFISRTKDVLGATRDVRDITKIIGSSQESRDKLAIALGPQRAREFQAVLRGEEIMQKLKEAVQGNSSTVMQLLGAGAAGAAGGGYLGFDPTTSGITSALAGGLKKGADANMARHITRLMMSRDPAVLQAGIRQLARNARNLEIMQRVSNAITRAAAQQGVEHIPGRQAGGPVEEDRPYVVGERGPEVIVPDRDGTVVPQDEIRRYLRATTQDYPKFGPGGIPVNPEAFTAAVGGWPESSNVEDRRPERAAAEAQAAREAAAARTGRRGRQEGAGTRFVEGGYGIPAAYRALDRGAQDAFESAGKIQHYGNEYYDPAPVVQAALGATGSPLAVGGLPAGSVGAGVGPLWHGVSKIKLPRPVADMSATHIPTTTLAEKTIDPAALQGGWLMPAVGDRSRTGSLLSMIGDTNLPTPVTMQGGPGFMPANAGTGSAWASTTPSVGSRLTNQARKLGAEGDPVYFPYTAMGERSVDFSHHVSDALAESMKVKPPSAAAVEAFDAKMAGVKGWPGLGADNLKEFLAAAPGDVRNKFAKAMDTSAMQKLGLPSVAEVRYAVTDPRLLDAPTGSAGQAIAQLTGQKVANPVNPHRTYGTQIGGEYVGGFERSVPKELMYPDMLKAYKRMGYDPLEYDYLMRQGLTGAPTAQRANQKWVDTVSRYLEANRQGR